MPNSMESALPTGITTEQGVLPFRDIHESFRDTSYGKILAENIRYRFFKPQGTSNAEWERLLGPDVNNLEHHWVSYRVMRAFLRAHPDFSPEEQEILLLTAVTHDWAEAVIGDIPYGQKTGSEEEEELHLIPTIALECFGEHLARPVRQTIDQVLRWKPELRKTGDGPKLAHAFEVVEQLGFLGTGGRSWSEAGRREGLSPALHENLQWIGLATHTHVPILLRYAEIYPAVRRYLLGIRQRITDVLRACVPLPASLAKEALGKSPELLLQHVSEAHAAWEQWLQGYPSPCAEG